MADAPLQRQSSDVRRPQIVEAGRKVFLARGLVRARVREIADEAGLTEASIWSHFGSKEEIFVAAVFDPLEEHVTQVLETMDFAGIADAETRHAVFTEIQESTLEVFQRIGRLLGVALFSDPGLGAEYYRDRLVPLFELWVKGANRTRKLWPYRQQDMWTGLTVAWGIHFGIAVEAAMSGRRLDVRKTARQIADILYYGLEQIPSTA